eukprot:scaffold2600_cov238-Pinguiococcus_pyrenoidosus.AAC.7
MFIQARSTVTSGRTRDGITTFRMVIRSVISKNTTTISPRRNDTSQPTLWSNVMFAPNAIRYTMQKMSKRIMKPMARYRTSWLGVSAISVKDV